MCTQTPVLTSTTSCFSEVSGEAALYVAPDDITAIAHGLSELLQNDALHARLKANCQYQANRFSAKTMSHILVEMYQKLLK